MPKLKSYCIFHKKGFKKHSVHRFRFMGYWVYDVYVSDWLTNRCKTPAILKIEVRDQWKFLDESLCLQSNYGCDVQTRVYLLINMLYKSNGRLFPECPEVHQNPGWMIVHWESTPNFCISGLNNSFYQASPPRFKRKYGNITLTLINSHLNCFIMYIFPDVDLKYSLQEFAFVYVNYVNERKNFGTKSPQIKHTVGAKTP